MFSISLLIDNNLQIKANYKIKLEFCPAFIYEPLYSTREVWYYQKKLVGVCGLLPKTLALLITKICDFPYPLYDQIKNLITYLQPLPLTQLP